MNNLFFFQTIQDTIALYYRIPVREFKLSHNKEIFLYCKEINFFNLDYTNKLTFLNSLKVVINSIPDFFSKDIIGNQLLKDCNNINLNDLEILKRYLTFTRSSFSPFFIRALNESKAIISLKILFHIYLLFFKNKEKNYDFVFLNYSYRVYFFKDKVFIFGPIMINRKFDLDKEKMIYIKNIKNFFELQLHAHELVNLINQRNPIAIDNFNMQTEEMMTLLLDRKKFLKKNYSYKKSELREVATELIVQYKHKDKLNIFSTIKNNQILRDLEGLEWFNDLIFNYLSFGASSDKQSNNALDFLQIKLQADAYMLCNYDHAQENIIVDECNISDIVLKNKLSESIDNSNRNGDSIKNSFTYEVISDYLENNIPIKLVEDMTLSKHKLCNVDSSIGSLLSIPLVFDKRVFAVLHFIGYEKFKFDEIDKQFLLKLSSAVSKEKIDCRFSDNTEKMVSLLEGLQKKIDYNYLQEKTDERCKNIAKVFSSDGAIIWFNKKEVFQTPKETNELTILSQINFLDEPEKKEEKSYSLLLDRDKSLIKQHLNKEITVIDDIHKQCTNNQEDIFFMKYKNEFEKKGIISMMFVPIKNYEGKFSGAIMVFDKSYRNYNQLSQNMLKRLTLHMGSILNTVTYATYRAKRLDEQNLHESAQYLNIINSRARDLEGIVKKLYINDNYERYKLFLNIEDIKDFTAFTRKYLFTLFKGGEFVVTKYDELIKEGVKAIQDNTEYISVRKSLNQVLITHEKKMNQTKDIIYEKSITQNIAIKIPKQQFHDILNNIINNAIKYGKIGTYIKVSDEYAYPYFYNIYIENIGYIIDPVEKDRIFKKGVRGRITKEEEFLNNKEFQENTIGNKGLGLFFTKILMKKGLCGNVKLYKSEPIGNTGFSKHIFVLKIPIKMTRKT